MTRKATDPYSKLFQNSKTCRARCGLCTLWREKWDWCNANIRYPVFYNTPTFGCECFDDNGEEIRKEII